MNITPVSSKDEHRSPPLLTPSPREITSKKSTQVFAIQKEGLLGGSRCCDRCCFSSCSYADRRNNSAFACVGKIVCLPITTLLCFISCGKWCNPCCHAPTRATFSDGRRSLFIFDDDDNQGSALL